VLFACVSFSAPNSDRMNRVCLAKTYCPRNMDFLYPRLSIFLPCTVKLMQSFKINGLFLLLVRLTVKCAIAFGAMFHMLLIFAQIPTLCERYYMFMYYLKVFLFSCYCRFIVCSSARLLFQKAWTWFRAIVVCGSLYAWNCEMQACEDLLWPLRLIAFLVFSTLPSASFLEKAHQYVELTLTISVCLLRCCCFLLLYNWDYTIDSPSSTTYW